MRISDLLANEAPHDASAQIPSRKLRRGAAVREDFLKLKPKAGEGANDTVPKDLVARARRQISKRKSEPKTSG